MTNPGRDLDAVVQGLKQERKMNLHTSAFEYLSPTAGQLAMMKDVRQAFTELAAVLNQTLPDGPDKTYVIRSLRAVSMWANVCITRDTDGSPRRAIDDTGGE